MYNNNLISVLFIIYDLERGGPEMRLLDLAENLPLDIRMFICVTSDKLSLLDRFKQKNVEVIVVPVNKAYLEFFKIWKIAKIVRRKRISIVNTYDLKGLTIALCIKLFNFGKISLVHNAVDLLHKYNSRQKMVLRILLKGVDRIVSNSREAKELFGKSFFPEENITVIPNGVDVTRFNRDKSPDLSLKKSLGISGDTYVIGTIANLRKEKEYPFLLIAFKQLLERYPQLLLLCVGGGPLLNEIKSLAEELGVSDRTVFTGYVENVPDYLCLMDVLVLCSSKEGFPNALIQAMSMEVPVVASAVGGCLEIVDNTKDGYLFVPGDSEEFVSRVSSLIEQGELAVTFARKAKAKVHEHFTLEKMVQRYMDYFRNIARV